MQSKEIPDTPKATRVPETIEKAVRFYSKLQTEDGHWAGDYGGPLFLMPGEIHKYLPFISD